MAGNIVAEWLRCLHLGQYAESFIDNGYDDLEICKQVGDPDLDAIGVFNVVHRSRILQSVRTLREEGAASVYFTLEEGAAMHEECFCDNVSARSSGTSSGRSEKEVSATTTNQITASPEASSSAGTGQEGAKYLDEYEEGKAELVKIPRLQFKVLLQEKLSQDGIRLNYQPYSTPDGDRGYLEGLASRYADLFNTHYGDVLGHLDDLRRLEWATSVKTSPKEYTIVTPGTPTASHNPASVIPGLTSSQSQPIYVPGKYSPSSCLTDKEEDEIYGFGYGIFAAQIVRQQQRLLGYATTSHQPLLLQQQHSYQTCLSPRSAYFYEFPPNEQNLTNTCKKRTSFARFLRSLKTSHRKEKHGTSSPRHGRAAPKDVPQRVDTPDSVLQSGLGLIDLGQHAVIRSIVDPRDYDRLRHLQMNGGTPNTFEETIYKLKLQEALRKREKFTKEHEEILKDIKQGLVRLGKEGIRQPLTSDDTYMYDEDACMLTPSERSHNRGHWYDEPPYESDPEDFLMSNSPGPTATIQNGRVCFTLNLRQEPRGEELISLSARDISVPRDICSSTTSKGMFDQGLILPKPSYPPTIPLRSSRESGDYAGSDVQSISSRLSTLSVDTSQSEQEIGEIISPQYFTHLEDKTRNFKTASEYPRGEDGLSKSSDYDDQEGSNECSQQITTVHMATANMDSHVTDLPARAVIYSSRRRSPPAQQSRSFPSYHSAIDNLVWGPTGLNPAGSEGNIADSSSEGNEHQRLIRQSDGTPFGRGQFSRDSGSYDASVFLPSQAVLRNLLISPHGESDTSDDTSFSDNKNNLDSVVVQCNNEILARVRYVQKYSINLKKKFDQPNILSNSLPTPTSDELKMPKDSYVSVQGQTTLIDPGHRNGTNRSAIGRNEEIYEADQKLTSVKYVIGKVSDLNLNEPGTLNLQRRSCLSEKSSDSGVSSSSLSSANTKDFRPVHTHHIY